MAEEIVTIFWLLVCALMDIKRKQVHIFALIAFGATAVVYHLIMREISWYSLLGGVLLGAVFIAVSLLSKESIGLGDGLMIFNLGIMLGFAKCLTVVWVGCLFAGMTGACLLFIYRKDKKYRMPYIPFLLAGYIVLVFIQRYGGFS